MSLIHVHAPTFAEALAQIVTELDNQRVNPDDLDWLSFVHLWSESRWRALAVARTTTKEVE